MPGWSDILKNAPNTPAVPNSQIHTPPPPPAPDPIKPDPSNTAITNYSNTGSAPAFGSADYQAFLASDPFYQQTLAYLNAAAGLNSQGLGLTNQGYDIQSGALNQQIGFAKDKNALSVKGINEQNQYNQLAVTQDLASREATESGDNAYYHTKVQTATDNALKAAQLDLSDYLAGAQAALAEIGINKQQAALASQEFLLNQQQSLNAAQMAAFERDTTLWTATHPAPVPPAPKQPDPTPPPPSQEDVIANLLASGSA